VQSRCEVRRHAGQDRRVPPDTGEPAIFIKDDKAFIAKLAAAQKLTIKIVEKGKGQRTLTYEVGGYDAARFPQLARAKK
jgi:hypothetical protein